jgi:hypothetical protein
LFKKGTGRLTTLVQYRVHDDIVLDESLRPFATLLLLLKIAGRTFTNPGALCTNVDMVRHLATWSQPWCPAGRSAAYRFVGAHLADMLDRLVAMGHVDRLEMAGQMVEDAWMVEGSATVVATGRALTENDMSEVNVTLLQLLTEPMQESTLRDVCMKQPLDLMRRMWQTNGDVLNDHFGALERAYVFYLREMENLVRRRYAVRWMERVDERGNYEVLDGPVHVVARGRFVMVRDEEVLSRALTNEDGSRRMLAVWEQQTLDRLRNHGVLLLVSWVEEDSLWPLVLKVANAQLPPLLVAPVRVEHSGLMSSSMVRDVIQAATGMEENVAVYTL